MSDHARTIADILLSCYDTEPRVILTWLHQVNAPRTNIELIMGLLIAHKDREMATRATEQLQCTIDGNALGEHFGDLLEWLNTDPSSGAELVSEIVERPMLVKHTDADDAFDDDDAVFVRFDDFE